MSYKEHDTEAMNVPDDNISILIIEDNTVISDFLKSILQRNLSPCAVSTVNCIAGAMACLPEKSYDLILLDTTLDLKAEDSCEAIRDHDIGIPIILMAMSETKITYEYVVGCGADGIIYKPIESDQLLKEIGRLIDINWDERGTPSSYHRALKPKDDDELFD